MKPLLMLRCCTKAGRKANNNVVGKGEPLSKPLLEQYGRFIGGHSSPGTLSLHLITRDLAITAGRLSRKKMREATSRRTYGNLRHFYVVLKYTTVPRYRVQTSYMCPSGSITSRKEKLQATDIAVI